MAAVEVVGESFGSVDGCSKRKQTTIQRPSKLDDCYVLKDREDLSPALDDLPLRLHLPHNRIRNLTYDYERRKTESGQVMC